MAITPTLVTFVLYVSATLWIQSKTELFVPPKKEKGQLRHHDISSLESELINEPERNADMCKSKVLRNWKWFRHCVVYGVNT